MRINLGLNALVLFAVQAFFTHDLPAQNRVAWPVTGVACGNQFTLFTGPNGSLWVMGLNSTGQLGLGPGVMNTNVPQQIFTNGVGAIAAGSTHSLFIMNHAVWAMGDNGDGQLGDGMTNTQYFPEQVFSVNFRTGFTALAAGGGHSLFGTSSLAGGGLWAMGDDDNGQLGDGTFHPVQDVPEEVLSSSPGATASAIACGGRTTLFIQPDGSLWAMGYDGTGQLGDGMIADRNVPFEITLGDVVAVAVGTSHSLFVYSDNSLWAMSNDDYGQLGDGTPPGNVRIPEFICDDVVAVAAGYLHSLFIKSDGSLWAVGYNGFGQLGDGTTTDRSTPVQIVPDGVVAIAAGGFHSFFIKSDGSLWGMGANSAGQLGDGTYTDHDLPEPIVAAPPVLTIIPYGANVILTWPTNAVGFNLQATPDLTSPAAWSAFPRPPIVIGDTNLVIDSVSDPQRFYRLSQ